MLLAFPLLQILAMSNCFSFSFKLPNDINKNIDNDKDNDIMNSNTNSHSHSHSNISSSLVQSYRQVFANSGSNGETSKNTNIKHDYKSKDLKDLKAMETSQGISAASSSSSSSISSERQRQKQKQKQKRNEEEQIEKSDRNNDKIKISSSTLASTTKTRSVYSTTESSTGLFGGRNPIKDEIKMNKMDFDGSGEFFDVETMFESNQNQNVFGLLGESEKDNGNSGSGSVSGGGFGSGSVLTSALVTGSRSGSGSIPSFKRRTVYEYVPLTGVYAFQHKSFLEEMQESKEKKTNLINDGADDSWVPAVSAAVIVLIVFSISVFACCLHCPFCFVYRMNDSHRII